MVVSGSAATAGLSGEVVGVGKVAVSGCEATCILLTEGDSAESFDTIDAGSFAARDAGRTSRPARAARYAARVATIKRSVARTATAVRR